MSASVFCTTAGALWGKLCLLRETTSSGFRDRELRLLQRLAPHIARGLRRGTLVSGACGLTERADADRRALSSAPGVVVVEFPRRVTLCTGAASLHLEDLADVGAPEGEPPCALVSAIGLLDARARLANGASRHQSEDVRFHALGRSGTWYVLHPSRAEPDATGRSSTVVIVEPLVSRDVAPVLSRLYGLTPRERQVVSMVARGESTRCVGERLGLSEYTVQEHLGNACAKVGVRGRRALLAKLYYDAFSLAPTH